MCVILWHCLAANIIYVCPFSKRTGRVWEIRHRKASQSRQYTYECAYVKFGILYMCTEVIQVQLMKANVTTPSLFTIM